MELPIELKLEIEKQLETQKINVIQEKAEDISIKYRTQSGTGKRLVTEKEEALSYAAVRMPATYGAVYTVMQNLIQILPSKKFNTLLDVGAGTGAGTWATSQFFNLEKIICLEREDVMRSLGKSLMNISNQNCIKNAQWQKFDLQKEEITTKSDIILASYVLNEMNKNDYLLAVEKLWNATNDILIIIEPGTPVGFCEIKNIREELIKKGANILAPCPHMLECKIANDDWCHTTCRIARSKMHKNLKGGVVPYEDEKFSYIIASKNEKTLLSVKLGRVLRHPKIEPGKITLDICKTDGTIQNIVVTKKEKDLFKIARKAKCGDLI